MWGRTWFGIQIVDGWGKTFESASTTICFLKPLTVVLCFPIRKLSPSLSTTLWLWTTYRWSDSHQCHWNNAALLQSAALQLVLTTFLGCVETKSLNINLQSFYPELLQPLTESISGGYNGALLICGGASLENMTPLIDHSMIKQVEQKTKLHLILADLMFSHSS